jgi:hypothetical protein
MTTAADGDNGKKHATTAARALPFSAATLTAASSQRRNDRSTVDRKNRTSKTGYAFTSVTLWLFAPLD